ncbi:hypothetical protein AnigIFM62618_005475 [Aspergillus niger]|nr:hypothetical protein AnigIFM62618_005475 [Aspergillus niger]
MGLFQSIKAPFSKRRYEALHHEFHENTGEKPLCTACQRQFRGRRKLRELNICVMSGVFFTTVIIFLLLAVLFDTYLNSEKNAALRGSLYWSPILDDVELPQRIATMNSTLLPPPDPSIARQEPGPENDAEWYKYNDTPLFWLTREEIGKLGQNPDTAAKWDRKYWGHDKDLYVGKLDISHKAYDDYPGYHPNHHHDKRERNSSKMDWIHLSHCIDMLLQFVLCKADTGIVTFTYVEGQEAPWPDFHLKRQCGNLEPLLDWAKGREGIITKGRAILIQICLRVDGRSKIVFGRHVTAGSGRN